jgi:hypothetical protein
MNCERTLIASVVMLALGLGLIFTYCHGTIGFNAAYPASGASLQVAINTTGLAAMTGVGSTIIGLLLLIVALIQAVVNQIRWPGESPKHQSSAA